MKENLIKINLPESSAGKTAVQENAFVVKTGYFVANAACWYRFGRIKSK